MEKWQIEHEGFVLAGTAIAKTLLIWLMRKGVLTADEAAQVIANALASLAPETRLPETAAYAEAATGYLEALSGLLQQRDPRSWERKPSN